MNYNPKDALIACILYRRFGSFARLTRRYGFNHNLEVLVQWDKNSLFSAQWVPQSRLHSCGEKELESYLSRQLLFSPLWTHVLNVAEVVFRVLIHG